jgi:hypothetical protein
MELNLSERDYLFILVTMAIGTFTLTLLFTLGLFMFLEWFDSRTWTYHEVFFTWAGLSIFTFVISVWRQLYE